MPGVLSRKITYHSGKGCDDRKQHAHAGIARWKPDENTSDYLLARRDHMHQKPQLLNNAKAHEWDYTLPWKRENVLIRPTESMENRVKKTGVFLRVANMIKAIRVSYS